MQITRQERVGTLVVRVGGELDVRTAGAFRDKVDELVAASAQQRVVLNLSRVTFLDSTGLGAILGRVRRWKERDRQVVLVPPSGVARTVLDMAALGRTVAVYPSERAALGEVAGIDG